jgi:glyoxylase-like metal-dependent hydrolase (beta-lactamase superfamily II)
LLSHLPNARVLVHPRGAPHLIDPSFLQAATAAVYGEKAYAELYGDLVPIAPDRVDQSHDGQRLHLGRSELTVLHTPGHALHHHVLFDAVRSAVFTGDTFGLSYRELDTARGAFIVPTTTPTQFDPVTLIASVRRIAALEPLSIYLTHYGRVTGAAGLAQALCEQIERYAALAERHALSHERDIVIRAALRDDLVIRAAAHGVLDPATSVDTILGNDLDLNTQGLLAWLDRVRASQRPTR